MRSLDHMFRLDGRFYVGEGPLANEYLEKFLSLSQPDRTCLVGILVRDRYARAIGVSIPIEKLLNKEPL